jgi:hypothetical protein
MLNKKIVYEGESQKNIISESPKVKLIKKRKFMLVKAKKHMENNIHHQIKQLGDSQDVSFHNKPNNFNQPLTTMNFVKGRVNIPLRDSKRS